MKKSIIIFSAASLLFLSCNSGSAASPDNKEKAPATVELTNEETGKTIHLTKAMFLDRVMDYETNQTQWVYEGDKPALIDFYADWCGPCRQAAPVLEELAEEYKGQIYIYKIDTQKEQELAAVFGIRSIPAFLFVPQEGKPTMSNGIAQTPEATKAMFKQMIDEILLEKKAASEGEI